ncbi:hypothetical protein MTO96_024269 [Rhipicephalus appendiculatus]
MASPLPVAAALLCLLSGVKSLVIDKSDGGYKDLLISINRDVPYNETIVENIKACNILQISMVILDYATGAYSRLQQPKLTLGRIRRGINVHTRRPLQSLLRSSSDFLHLATNGRVYFKHVTIDFPNTWPKRSNARRVSSSSFEKSDVRVDLPGSPAEEQPFTKQSRLCGAPGDYIKLTPTFLAELNASTTKTFRNPAYVFVHEWAHYRYGVFDEHGSRDDDKHPVTYCEDGKVKLNACSTKFRYIPKLASGGKCTKLNKTTCTFSKDCIIHIYASAKDPVESSVMFMPLPRPDMSKRIEVLFEETQQREDLPQRIVLLLDVSTSMDENSRMKFLKKAATQYIQDIEDGSKRLAIITFSNNATVRHPLMTVNGDTRQGFLNTIKHLETVWSTCIGCGLLRALEVLTTKDETPEGSIIVLISDGIENETPHLKDVLPQLTKDKVEISTMALGAEADNQLEMLATATRGKAFSFQDLQGNTALLMETAFLEATTAQSGTDNDYVTLIDAARKFTTRSEEKLVLEPSLGNDTVVLVELVKPMHADITPGEWTIRVESQDSRPVEVNIQVKSKGKDPNSEPIRVNCRVASLEVSKPDEAIIYADVNKGRKAVLDATVVAEVTGPNEPHKSTVQLRDDGRGAIQVYADVQANDGTYSGYFDEFTGKGRYAVTAHVSSDNRTRVSDPKVASGSVYSNTMFPEPSGSSEADTEADHEYSVDDFEDDDSTAKVANQTSTSVEPAGAFQRVAAGGSFQVTEEIVQSQVPPGDIGDLTVVEVRPGANDTLEAQLLWTWPGAHLMSGNASAVEIRASKDDAKLDSDFEKQEQITMTDVVEGNLDPLPAGSKHKVTFAFATKWATRRPDGAFDWKIFLAARAANSDGMNGHYYHHGHHNGSIDNASNYNTSNYDTSNYNTSNHNTSNHNTINYNTSNHNTSNHNTSNYYGSGNYDGKCNYHCGRWEAPAGITWIPATVGVDLDRRYRSSDRDRRRVGRSIQSEREKPESGQADGELFNLRRPPLLNQNCFSDVGYEVFPPAPKEALSLRFELLPQWLKRLGYSTHMVGKWHLGYKSLAHTPTWRGFDTFFGYYNGDIFYFNHTITYPLFLHMCHEAGHTVCDNCTAEAPKENVDHFKYISNYNRTVLAW